MLLDAWASGDATRAQKLASAHIQATLADLRRQLAR